MDAGQFPPELYVAEILQKGQAVTRVFIRNKTACVGCYLARFCTLSDVARIYDLSLEEFRGELMQAVQAENPAQLGVKNETLD